MLSAKSTVGGHSGGLCVGWNNSLKRRGLLSGILPWYDPRIVILTSLRTHFRELIFNAGCFSIPVSSLYRLLLWLHRSVFPSSMCLSFCLGDVTGLCVRYFNCNIRCASVYLTRSFTGTHLCERLLLSTEIPAPRSRIVIDGIVFELGARSRNSLSSC